MIEIAAAKFPSDADQIRQIFREYEEWLDVDLCFQGFEEELRELPGKYAEPKGRILIAKDAGRIAGCVAVRPLPPDLGACEMKRLYVRPQWRGQGLGRRLADASLAAAREGGYRVMRLDTLARLHAALDLYQSMGFRPIEPYYENPLKAVIYLETDLK